MRLVSIHVNIINFNKNNENKEYILKNRLISYFNGISTFFDFCNGKKEEKIDRHV